MTPPKNLLKREKQNPIDTVFSRLVDAVHFWNLAATSYHDYQLFKTNANACIQTIRSVTFVLQKKKEFIKEFDNWYGKWQEKMKNDKILRWIISARNIIEKQGDLETNSVVKVQVIASYSESPFIEFQIPPFTGVEECLKIVNKKDMPEHLRENGTIRLERIWVASELEDTEILEALAYACNYLFDLVIDAYAHIGNVEKSSELIAKRDEYILKMNESYRTIFVKISTGETFYNQEQRIRLTSEEKVIKRYGKLKPVGRFESLEDEIRYMLETAMTVFKKDKFHLPMVIFLLPDNKRLLMALTFGDQSEKYVMWRKVAQTAQENNAIAVITILESWIRPADVEDERMLNKNYSVENRRECLTVTGISQKGEEITLFTEIERIKDDVSFSEIKKIKGEIGWFLLPIKRLWRQKKISDEQYRINRLSRIIAPHIDKTWKLDRNAPCLCLSGKKYKKCCQDNIEKKLQEKASLLVREHKYAEAELAYRAWLTQYMVWVNTQTIPAIKASSQGVDEMVITDIEAVSEIVEDIAQCLLKQGKATDDFLERAITLMDDRRYRFYATVLRSCFLLREGHGDYKKAKSNLKKIDPESLPNLPRTSRSKQMIQVYIDLIGSELDTDIALKFIDNLLALLIRPIEKIDLLIKKSLIYYLALDVESAEKIIDEALSLENLLHPENVFERKIMLNAVGRANELKALFSKDDRFRNKAIEYYEELLSLIHDDKESTGDVHQKLAHVYRGLDKPDKMIQNLEIAYAMNPSWGIKLDLIQGYMISKEYGKAGEFMLMIDEFALDDAFKIDFYEYKGVFARKKNDIEEIGVIVKKLKALTFTSEFLENRKSALLKYLEEIFLD